MQNQAMLRQQLLSLLTGKDAHADFETAIAHIPEAARGKRPAGAEHSPWEVLEHLRITQWDILEFTRDAKHASPEFPAGYWPTTQAPPNEAAWDASMQKFREDLKAFCELVSDEATDLLAKIPHGDGQTVLREALLASDHTAYHLGELVLLRRVLGVWS
jgi:hypothetical protein